MKERYRNMMEQVTLSEKAREAVTAKLEQGQKPKRRPSLVRAAVIAACVCLVLVGGALGAEHFSGVWTTGEESGTEQSSYRVNADLETRPLEELGEELQADLAAGTLRPTFDDRDSLEDYLGIELIHSTALENAGIVEDLETAFQYGFDLRPELAVDPNARYVLTGTTVDGEAADGIPEVLKVSAHRVMENSEVYIDARIITEQIDPEVLRQGLLGENFRPLSMVDSQVLFDEEGNAYWEITKYTSAEHEFTTTSYKMPNGIEATIVTATEVYRDGTLGAREYAGYFVCDGILYTVRPYAVDDPNQSFPMLDGDMLIVLERVLDTFE